MTLPHLYLYVVCAMTVIPTNLAIGQQSLTKYVPLDINSPVTEGKNLRLLVPTSGKTEIGNPSELYEHVKDVWDVVIQENQAGLMDAKIAFDNSQTLSKDEAWHHFQAGKQGVIDSARFLITFNLLTSVQQGGEPLHIATIHGDLKRIRSLIENNHADVDLFKSSDGFTPLLISSALGHEDCVDLFIQFKANVNHMSKNGITPLMAASAMGYYTIAEKLLKAGAQPDQTHPFGKTSSMHFASEMGHADIISLLCQYGADANIRKTNGATPLHVASDTNQTQSVIALISKCSSNTDLLVAGDTTPLYLAAQRGFVDVIEALLVIGHVNPNFVMPEGSHKGELIVYADEQKKFYKEKNTELGNGATALHAAVENGHLLAVRMLLKHGAKQLPSMKGATPLLIALQYRHPRIAMNLLSKGQEAHVNKATPHDGMFPLFVATQYGYHNVVERLLDRSAKIDKKLKGNGHTATDIAISYNHPQVLKVFRTYLEKTCSCNDKECNNLGFCQKLMR